MGLSTLDNPLFSTDLDSGSEPDTGTGLGVVFTSRVTGFRDQPPSCRATLNS